MGRLSCLSRCWQFITPLRRAARLLSSSAAKMTAMASEDEQQSTSLIVLLESSWYQERLDLVVKRSDIVCEYSPEHIRSTIRRV